MKKCEWKDGKFYPCDNFDPMGCVSRESDKIEMICHECKVSIEKQIRIKPSGKTFVGKCNGVDYLCHNPRWYFETLGLISEDRVILRYPDYWTSIDKIESEGITDEIAMLRPIMIDDETNTLYTLWGYDVGFCVTGNGCIPAEELRIARVGDLP
jgi:hypothetical protein